MFQKDTKRLTSIMQNFMMSRDPIQRANGIIQLYTETKDLIDAKIRYINEEMKDRESGKDRKDYMLEKSFKNMIENSDAEGRTQ